jgi:RimJ/RimL family protein N-acetyltransferase
VIVPTVVALTQDDWETLRELRLSALAESPQWFAATLEEETAFDEDEWRRELRVGTWCAAVLDDRPIGLMGVTPTDRHDCDCWLHGSWVEPRFRHHGVTRLMLAWLDGVARQRGWQRIGLGVWPENTPAIAVWERLGFVAHGGPLPSSRRPGQLYLAMRRELASTV